LKITITVSYPEVYVDRLQQVQKFNRCELKDAGENFLLRKGTGRQDKAEVRMLVGKG
jgi:hypothetical protein